MSDDKKSKIDTNTSAAKSLFLGNIVEGNFFPFPKVSPEEAETLRMVIDSIDKFMDGKGEQYREFDREGAQTPEYIEQLKELGLFGLIIPEDFGGIGFSNTAYSRVLQQTSRYDASTSLTIGAHSSIGMKGLLLFGNDEQKKKYLPKLASGEMVAAFCLTEAGAGSDAASIKTTATKNDDGSWTLTGEKIWITNGPIADFFTVFAKTAGDQGKMSAFIVERSFAGVSSGPKEDKMGIRASSTSTVVLSNVRVPAENLLGEEGKGFKVAMAILNNGRTGLGGGAVGAMKELIKLSSRQAKERKQFGKSIAEFGLVKDKIGRMTVNCFAAECVVSMVAHYIDSGSEDYSVEAAISKVFATEVLWETADEALQVAGGNGFMREFPYERVVRDSRINRIFEGTNEILRLYIALSGMKDAGDYLKDVGKGLAGIFNDPIKGFGVLGSYAGKKISQITPLGRDKIDNIPSVLKECATVFEQGISGLQKSTEVLLKRHGRNIIEKQFAMRRIADLTIDIFVGICVISRVAQMIEEKSAEKCASEISIAKIFAQRAERRITANLEGINKNEDEELKSLADFVMENDEGYAWDTL